MIVFRCKSFSYDLQYIFFTPCLKVCSLSKRVCCSRCRSCSMSAKKRKKVTSEVNSSQLDSFAAGGIAVLAKAGFSGERHPPGVLALCAAFSRTRCALVRPCRPIRLCPTRPLRCVCHRRVCRRSLHGCGWPPHGSRWTPENRRHRGLVTRLCARLSRSCTGEKVYMEVCYKNVKILVFPKEN